jgi:hypothetical protein
MQIILLQPGEVLPRLFHGRFLSVRIGRTSSTIISPQLGIANQRIMPTRRVGAPSAPTRPVCLGKVKTPPPGKSGRCLEGTVSRIWREPTGSRYCHRHYGRVDAEAASTLRQGQEEAQVTNLCYQGCGCGGDHPHPTPPSPRLRRAGLSLRGRGVKKQQRQNRLESLFHEKKQKRHRLQTCATKPGRPRPGENRAAELQCCSGQRADNMSGGVTNLILPCAMGRE